MESQSILELPAHLPPWNFGISVMDSTLLFKGTCGSVLYYMTWFCVVLFHATFVKNILVCLGCQWLKQHQCYKTKITSISISFKKHIMEFGSGVSTTCRTICVVHSVITTAELLWREHPCVPSWTSNCVVIFIENLIVQWTVWWCFRI